MNRTVLTHQSTVRMVDVIS